MARLESGSERVGPRGPTPPGPGPTLRLVRGRRSGEAATAPVECLACGRRRLVPVPPPLLGAGLCRGCGYGGWAYAGELSDWERRAIRFRMAALTAVTARRLGSEAEGDSRDAPARPARPPTSLREIGTAQRLADLAPRVCGCGGRVVPRRLERYEPLGGPAVVCTCGRCGRTWAVFADVR